MCILFVNELRIVYILIEMMIIRFNYDAVKVQTIKMEHTTNNTGSFNF